jgi:Helix-turn-helix domain
MRLRATMLMFVPVDAVLLSHAADFLAWRSRAYQGASAFEGFRKKRRERLFLDKHDGRNPMLITRGYRTELDLNNEQITMCKKHAGTARFAYNWGLTCKRAVYKETGRSISAIDLHRELNALKQTDFPWMYRYTIV